jgi:hypothetical protein
MSSTRVEYRGSVESAFGCRYVIAEEVRTGDRVRYDLATDGGEVVLRNVRPTSVIPVPEGPKHRVLSAEIRAQIVQAEFTREHPPGSWLPDIHQAIATLPRRVADLITANRPVEAEAALLNAEVFAGCITRPVFQSRMTALVVAGGDPSWLP